MENSPESKTTGGDITKSGKLLKQPLPAFLDTHPDLIRRIRELGAFAESKIGEPNHVIINEYLPGQGIMPHEDGPRYHPVVCTVSLGSHAIVNYYRYKDWTLSEQADEQGELTAGKDSTTGAPRPIDPKPVVSLLLEPRSLVITSSELYTRHLHGISPVTEDRFFCPEADGPVEDEAEDSGSELRVQVANAALLSGEKETEAVLRGGILERATRVSLTCRSVEEVLNASRFMK